MRWNAASSLATLPLGALLSLAGCTSATEPGTSREGVGGAADGGVAADTAEIRVLHLSPTTPPVDVFVDQAPEPAITGLPFREGTGYVALPAGEHRFDVGASGSALEDAVLTVGPLALAAGTRSTAVAIGNLSSIEALLLADDSAGIAESETRLRVAHVANGVGAVDVSATIGSATASVASDLEFGEAASPVDVNASSGLVVDLDANDDGSPDFTFDVPALPGGVLVNVFAVAENSQLSLVAQLPDGETVTLAPRGDASLGEARVRAVHLSPDAGPVDVYVNGADAPAIEDLEFGDATAYLTLPADRYVLDVAPANTSIDDAVARIGPANVTGGSTLSIVAIRRVAELGVLIVDDDASGIAPGDVRIRAAHAAVDVGVVDVRIGGECGLFVIGDDLELGEAGRAIDASAGLPYEVALDVGADGSNDLRFETPPLPAGVVIDAFAARDAEGAVFLLAVLPDGTTARIDPSPI